VKITLAQLNYIIGDFDGNSEKIINAINKAKKEQSDLIIFSELSICGYPPLDMLEHRYFIEKTEEAILTIAKSCNTIAAIVGAPLVNDKNTGKNLHNAAFFCYKGEVKNLIKKALLPTYDVFDEYRYFEPGTEFEIVKFKGKRIAITICEDLWYEQPLLSEFGKEKLYTTNPIQELIKQQPDFIVNIAASPFAYNHDNVKREVLGSNAKKYNIPLFYVNQVGAHTEIIFDGGSRVINADGVIVDRLPFFKEAVQSYLLEDIVKSDIKEDLFPIGERMNKIHDALILGVRDYFSKMNFKTATLGLSGGIDSAVTLAIAARALGSENLRVLLLPSKYSSEHSINDAVQLAEKLGVKYNTITIQEIVDQYEKQLSPLFSGLANDITEENIQARIRGTLLMALSNKFGHILLNTSNKSEAAVGYGTLYGDMNGGLSVLGDVYKSDVFQLARFINKEEEIIPENSITKPPSAELRPDQKDSDSLPDYAILDKILYSYIELRMSASEIINEGYNTAIVNKTIRMVNMNEYKRFQTPPILRVSSKAFGLGRRMPLVAKY
jgi:NAD+ synthase (glutamine-hydrolysing)